jgi:hypothetical protein
MEANKRGAGEHPPEHTGSIRERADAIQAPAFGF